MTVIQLDRHRNRRIRPTAAAPCPLWCTKSVGHGLDDSIGRLHHRPVAALDFAVLRHNYTQARVDIVQMQVHDEAESDPVFISCQLENEELLVRWF
jgi:hypothetical protein